MHMMLKRLHKKDHPKIYNKAAKNIITLVLALFLFSSPAAYAQIIPQADTTECFTAGDGALFMDPGGDLNYPNCGCGTTTTLCSPDGSPISLVFQEFSVFSTFDYIQIYDGDDVTAPLLYGNASGDPGAGDVELAEFIATNGSNTITGSGECLTVYFFATTVVDYPGWLAEVNTNVGHPGDGLQCGASLSCLPPGNFNISDVFPNSATASWNPPDSLGVFQIEYDTSGFPQGMGANLITTTDSTLDLTGLAENTIYDIYLQLLCDNGDSSLVLGPLTFQTPKGIDVGIVGIVNPGPDSCNYTDNEKVIVELKNFGRFPQTFVPFFFAVDGELVDIPYPADGLYTDVVGFDEVVNVAFETPYDFSSPGYYLIQAWTELGTDVYTENDTFSFELISAYPLPLNEDFEGGSLPAGWTTDETFNPIYAPNAHNNPTYVFSDNLYGGDPSCFLQSQQYGPLEIEDSLYFDYRFVNWFAGTVATDLGDTDSLKVLLSNDCGETFKLVHAVTADNHTPTTEMTTVGIGLSGYAGTAITIRFEGRRGTGDYWLDLDNINMTGCPASFKITGKITDESSSGAADGSIAVSHLFGVPPFTYYWNGVQGDSLIEDLEPGVYQLEVIDALGCSDQAEFTINTLVANSSPSVLNYVKIMPNPAIEQVTLFANFEQSTDLEVVLFNSVGHLVRSLSFNSISSLNHSISLSELSAGIYFVQLHTRNERIVKKLIIAK